MTLYFPGSDFGTTPRGDETKGSKGGEAKSPAILPSSWPFDIKLFMTSGKRSVRF